MSHFQDPPDRDRPDRDDREERDSRELDDALRQLFAGEDTAALPEPRPEELAALVSGSLDEAEEAALLERVAAHPKAFEELLELRRFPSAAEPGEVSPTDTEVAAGIDAVFQEVEVGVPATLEMPRPSPRSPASPPAAAPRAWWAVAAAVLLAVLTVIAWTAQRQSAHLEDRVADLEAKIASLEAPRAGAAILDLFPPGHLRGENEVPVLDLSAATEPAVATLLLTPPDPAASRVYRLRLETAAGEVLWRSEATADPSGAVVVVLPGENLPPGTLRFVLDAGAISEEVLFPFEVRGRP